MTEDGTADGVPFERFLSQASDAVDVIAAYVSWEDLFHLMSCCRAAFSSTIRQEFERKTRFVIPPDPDVWTHPTARIGDFRPRWSAVSVPHTALLNEKLRRANPSPRRVTIENQRFMQPRALASSPLDLLCLHRSFPQIQELNLSGISDLVDILPLACLLNLRCLDISDTGVHELSALSQLRLLKTLDVSKTRITTLEPLRGLPALATLNLDAASQLCSLEPLQSLPSLKALTVRRVKCDRAMEQLIVVAPRLVRFACCSKLLQSSRIDTRFKIFRVLLSAMPTVESFELASTVTLNLDVEDFVAMIRLRRLHVSILPARQLTQLTAFIHLRELSIISSRCVNLSALATLPNLRYLYCHGGDPDSMDTITASLPRISVPNLKQIDISNHYLARFTSLPKLEDLKVYVWSGDVLMMPIGCATNLRRLQLCGDLTLQEVYARFPHLEELTLQQCNSYEALDLTLFEKLRSLTVTDPFTDSILLPTNQLPHLHTLRLRGSNVKQLPPLSSVPNLVELDIERTSVDDLDSVKTLNSLQVLNLKNTSVRDVTPLLSVPSLKKVILPKSAVCKPLVDAYHNVPGSGLREVLHSTKNCLWGPHRRWLQNHE